MATLLRNLFFGAILFLSCTANSQCPKSEAWVGGRLSGDFHILVFQNQDRLNADRFCSGIRRETIIDSFNILIIRDTSIVFRSKNIGPVFNSNFMAFTKKLVPNDKVVFYSIWGTDYDATKVYLDPLEYRLSEEK